MQARYANAIGALTAIATHCHMGIDGLFCAQLIADVGTPKASVWGREYGLSFVAVVESVRAQQMTRKIKRDNGNRIGRHDNGRYWLSSPIEY
jgi:hypothetical protein